MLNISAWSKKWEQYFKLGHLFEWGAYFPFSDPGHKVLTYLSLFLANKLECKPDWICKKVPIEISSAF